MVLGQILTVAFALNRLTAVLDVKLAWDLYREVAFDEGRNDLLFALGGGAIGASYALQALKPNVAAYSPVPSGPGAGDGGASTGS